MNLDGEILSLVYKWDGYGMILYLLITTALAAFLPFLLALERKMRGKSISLKTHVLLSVGCSLLMVLAVWGIRIAEGSLNPALGPESFDRSGTYDTSRIAAAVVSGMGFLGAGTIIKDKLTVRGLSTAAKLWISAAVGIACGCGFLVESVVFTGFVLILIWGLNTINGWFRKKAPTVTVSAPNGYPLIRTIQETALENSLSVHDIDILEVGDQRTVAKAFLPLRVPETTVRYFADQLDARPDLTVLR